MTDDGDLSISRPYSTQINWEKKSGTQKALFNFIKRYKSKFKRTPLSHAGLVRELCQADSLKKLKASTHYRILMDKQTGKRVYPEIKSKIYRQTPRQYANRVIRKAQKYPLLK